MDHRHPKIIITRRVWQLLAALGFVLLTTLAQHYPLNHRLGLWLGEGVFIVVFGLTYLREERRAVRSPHSNLVINWNLAEAFLMFLSAAAFIIVPLIVHLPETYFYAYLHTFLLGLLSGVALGEFLWQNIRLKQLDESFQRHYWDNYKNSMF